MQTDEASSRPEQVAGLLNGAKSSDAEADDGPNKPAAAAAGLGQASLLSCVFNLTNTVVGAGMLALPSVCQRSGFVPSTCTLTVCWLYMVATGLLLLEVNLDTMCESGGGGVSLSLQ